MISLRRLVIILVISIILSYGTIATGQSVETIESDSQLIIRSGHWSIEPAAIASAGSYLLSNSQDDMLTLQFRGSLFEVIYVQGPNLGTLAIEIDGVILRTVSTTSEQMLLDVRSTINYLEDEIHTARVYAAEGMIAIDAFVVNELAVSAHKLNAYTTEWWAVELKPGTNPETIATDLGYTYLRQIASLPNIYLFHVPTIVDTATSTADRLSMRREVVWFEQQIARERSLRPVPNDPGLPNQWHLINTGQGGGTVGQDASLEAAWQADYDGSGVIIGIVDQGIETTHFDLAPNYNADASYDYVDYDNDPNPVFTFETHGTSVAGIALAAADEDSSSCGVGAAYASELAAMRIAFPTPDVVEADALANAHAYTPGVVMVSSNSWGPDDDGRTLEAPGTLAMQAIENQVLTGRNGLGTVFVWAGGNGGWRDNASADGYTSSRYTISVAATGNDGKRASYSEHGAAHLVNAPSGSGSFGIYTTDRSGSDGYNSSGDCYSGFGGTSASAPLVAGVVGLMLDANPNLSWRDVQHILVHTAGKNDPTHYDWDVNGAGHDYNHYYGFGRVDAGAATALASDWISVDPVVEETSGSILANLPLVDGDLTGVSDIYTVSDSAIEKLEHVEVIFNATHEYRGDIAVNLTSPSGTTSELMLTRNYDASSDGYDNWRFTSVHFWDEIPEGTWTLTVKDTRLGNIGTFVSWELVLYGTSGTHFDTLALFNTEFNYVALVDTLDDWPTWPDEYEVFVAGTGIKGEWVVGDWDGDGVVTPGVYADGANTGAFFFTNQTGTTPPDEWISRWIGFVGVPVAGRMDNDFDNDCIGIVEMQGTVPNDTYALHFTCDLNGPIAPTIYGQWMGRPLADLDGFSGERQYVMGDWDEDGLESIAVRRSEYIAYTNVSPSESADDYLVFAVFDKAQYIGAPGNPWYGQLVAGDWNADGVDSFGLFYNDGFGSFFRRNDLEWNSGVYILQHLGEPVGQPVQAIAWH